MNDNTLILKKIASKQDRLLAKLDELNGKFESIDEKHMKSVVKVWSVLSLFLLFYSVDTWLVTQGEDAIFRKIVTDDDRYPAALFGIIIGCPTFLISLLWLNWYMKLMGVNQIWYYRFPLIFNIDLKLDTAEGRVFQRLFFFILIVVPFCSQIHFLNTFRDGPLYDITNNEEVSFFKMANPFSCQYKLTKPNIDNFKLIKKLDSEKSETQKKNIITQLESVSGKEFGYEESFLFALEKAIGKDYTEKYKKDFFNNAEIDYRYGAKKKRVSFYPFFETILIILAELFLFYYLFLTMRRLFRLKKTK